MQYVIIVAVIATIFYICHKNSKEREQRENKQWQENLARTTAKYENVLTESGIPKSTKERHLPPAAGTPNTHQPHLEQIHMTYKAPETTTYNEINDKLPEDYATHKHTFASKTTSYSAYTTLVSPKIDSYALFKIDEWKNHIADCIFCGTQTNPDDTRTTLSNGLHVHKQCMAKACAYINSIKSDTELPAQGTKEYSTLLTLSVANQFWPTYPDDWPQRKHYIIRQAECECESCGEDEKPLHVHHIKELSTGGTNALSNLQCLCEDCHNAAHDTNVGKYDFTKGKIETK